jgi:hypothetical protein
MPVINAIIYGGYMLRLLLTLPLLLASLQSTEQKKVGRIYVSSSQNTSLIYAYAGVAFPAGEPLKDGAVECFVSEMKATGLFSDISVKLKPADEDATVDIYIKPTWNPRWSHFTIDKLVFENFRDIDEQKLREKLQQRGLAAGESALRLSLPEIKAAVEDTIHETSTADPEKGDNLREEYLNLSFKIRLVASEKVMLTIAPGHRDPCSRDALH